MDNMNKVQLLYIVFVDMDKEPQSGSSVRPARMYEAFQDMNVEVKLVHGINNDRSVRNNAIKDVSEWLKYNTPDLCYIEPPSGPLRYFCDRKLIRNLYKKGIPIGIYYRDAHWKFPEFGREERPTDIKSIIKNKIIVAMQKRDLNMWKKYSTIMYFTSKSFSDYFDFKRKELLPPGCQIISNNSVSSQKNEEVLRYKKISIDACKIPVGIFVGTTSAVYGTNILLDAAYEVNKNGVNFKLIIVTPEKSWRIFLTQNSKYREMKNEWLEVYHLNDGDDLHKLYEMSDFALLSFKKMVYTDFALPIKLFEYISHDLPVVSTDCNEVKSLVEQYDIGIVTKASVDEYSKGIRKMIENAENRKTFRQNCASAKKINSWHIRAKKIIDDFDIKGKSNVTK